MTKQLVFYDREKLQERLAKLAGGVALINLKERFVYVSLLFLMLFL